MRYFIKGFRILGWPLQILMSVMDFIKGFSETEGSIFEKITAGLREAIIGFLELPIRFFSWITEKVLGFFGFEITGIADNILSGIREMFDFQKILVAFEYFFTYIKTLGRFLILPLNALVSILAFAIGFFESDGSFLEKIAAGFKKFIRYWTLIPMKIVAWLLGTIGDFFGIEWLSDAASTAVDTVLGFVDNFIDTIKICS